MNIFDVHKKDKKLFEKVDFPPEKDTFSDIVANQPDSIINNKNFSKITAKICQNDVVNLVKKEPEKEDEVMEDAVTASQDTDVDMTPVKGPILVPIISDLFIEIDAFKRASEDGVKSEIFQKIIDQHSKTEGAGFSGVKNQYTKVVLQYFLSLFKLADSRHKFYQITSDRMFRFEPGKMVSERIIDSPGIDSPGNGLYITTDDADRTLSPKINDSLGKFFIEFAKQLILPPAPQFSNLDARKRAIILHMFDYFYNLLK